LDRIGGLNVLKMIVLGTLAAGTFTAVVIFLIQVIRQLSVADLVSTGEPTLPALAATFAVVLIAVGGADLARFFLKSARR
jgi:hypothetical protein